MTPDGRIALSRSHGTGNNPQKKEDSQKLVDEALGGGRVGNGRCLGRPRHHSPRFGIAGKYTKGKNLGVVT